MKKCQACAELVAQGAGDGGAGGEVDATFGVRSLAVEETLLLRPPASFSPSFPSVSPHHRITKEKGFCVDSRNRLAPGERIGLCSQGARGSSEATP